MKDLIKKRDKALRLARAVNTADKYRADWWEGVDASLKEVFTYEELREWIGAVESAKDSLYYQVKSHQIKKINSNL